MSIFFTDRARGVKRRHYYAAKALGISQQTGIIATGMAADLVRWSVKDSAQLCYYLVLLFLIKR